MTLIYEELNMNEFPIVNNLCIFMRTYLLIIFYNVYIQCIYNFSQLNNFTASISASIDFQSYI
jgi:hypothetical protein